MLVNELARMVRPLLPASVELKMEFASALQPVEGDPGQLEQVILNLCLNARDAMPDGGMLALRVDAFDAAALAQPVGHGVDAAHYVRITVEDNGIGMTAQVKERLFEPFFTTKPAGKGTGLGLSTAYGIVQGHRGFMRVESELGRGSRLEVFLPAALASTEAAREAPEDESSEAHGETVLVAEDIESVREVVVSMLEGAGYRVLTASDGERAVSMFRAHQAEIDLVLLDVVMPKLSGPEALAAMREIKPHLRAVFTSGYTDAGNFRAVRLTGAALVAKPYEPAVLLQTLRRALRARG
jgi:CheY-like chemotaxis protein